MCVLTLSATKLISLGVFLTQLLTDTNVDGFVEKPSIVTSKLYALFTYNKQILNFAKTIRILFSTGDNLLRNEVSNTNRGNLV